MTSVDSSTLARVLADALIEAGMREAVICPGSRSAPLVYALAAQEQRGRLRLHVRIDERSAGFLAHGLSLSTGRPVGVLTTSGTAVGNLLPAMMESFHAGTRLVALTADRPAELHGTGANQTTDQDGVFALHARFAATVDADAAADDDAAGHLREVASTVRRALLCADGFADGCSDGFADGCSDGFADGSPGAGARAVRLEERPVGPVHLNVRFREPLVPAPHQLTECARVDTVAPAAPAPADAVPCAAGVGPRDCPDAPWRAPGVDLLGDLGLDVSRRPARRTVVLACHGAGPRAAAFALASGLPLFAEPSSNARFSGNAIAAYPLLIGAEGGRSAQSHPLAGRIERVVLFGRPTLTRPVTALLARDDVRTALFAPESAPWFVPGRRRETPVETLEGLSEFAGQGETGWLAAWQRASMRAQVALEDVLVREDSVRGLSPQTVAHVTAAVTRGPLVLGSSSLVRDVDLTWHPPASPVNEVFANRGLAGIDGTLSTAMGVALGTRRPTVALVGDVTALHEIGGLLVGSGEPDADLDVVVVNDDGGAIFAGLEHGAVARAEGMVSTVERFFGTPHAADLAALAAGYGVPHVVVSDRVDLVHRLSEPRHGRRLIEVRCDRADRPLVTAAIADAVRSTFAAVPAAALEGES